MDPDGMSRGQDHLLFVQNPMKWGCLTAQYSLLIIITLGELPGMRRPMPDTKAEPLRIIITFIRGIFSTVSTRAIQTSLPFTSWGDK